MANKFLDLIMIEKIDNSLIPFHKVITFYTPTNIQYISDSMFGERIHYYPEGESFSLRLPNSYCKDLKIGDLVHFNMTIAQAAFNQDELYWDWHYSLLDEDNEYRKEIIQITLFFIKYDKDTSALSQFANWKGIEKEVEKILIEASNKNSKSLNQNTPDAKQLLQNIIYVIDDAMILHQLKQVVS